MGSSPIPATITKQNADVSSAFCIRPVGQAVKTPPFHGGNRSSILLRVTKSKRPPQSGWSFAFGDSRCESTRCVAKQHTGVRIPRPKIGVRLAAQGIHQAQGVGIFARNARNSPQISSRTPRVHSAITLKFPQTMGTRRRAKH